MKIPIVYSRVSVHRLASGVAFWPKSHVIFLCILTVGSVLFYQVRAFLAQPEDQRFGMVSKKGAEIAIHNEGKTHNLPSRAEPPLEVGQGGPLNKAVSRRSLLLKKPLLNNPGEPESTEPKTTTTTDFKERIHTKDIWGNPVHICPYCDFSSRSDPCVVRHI